jgi:membrane-bound ClpP family serine protease
MDSPSPAAASTQRHASVLTWSHVILLVIFGAMAMFADLLFLRLFVCTIAFLGFAIIGHLLLIQRDHAQRLQALERQLRDTTA